MRNIIFYILCCLPIIVEANNITLGDYKMSLNDILSNNIDLKTGLFINYELDESRELFEINLGQIPDLKYFMAAFRNKSCWMIPKVGKNVSEIPHETQFLLVETDINNYLMFIPLVDTSMRCSIGGNANGQLELIAETGDSLLCVNRFKALYILNGDNPYEMIKKASNDIKNELETFKLRLEKSVPSFVNYLGWCTWEALRTDFSEETLLDAAKHFKQNNIPFKYMLIDNGWLSQKNGKLTAFYPDKSKFPDGFGRMIDKLKYDYDFKNVIIWSSLWGTFSGLNEGSFPDMEIKATAMPVRRMVEKFKSYKSENLDDVATVGEVFYPGVNPRKIVIPSFTDFYNNFFDYLRREGADGVKIDAMTWVESVGHGRGGRVKMMKEMMFGLQGASGIHFNGNLLNCSSCSNDYIFNAISSNLTRTSGDFFPDKPESHGLHIYTNAVTSYWMGEIILPDWDMFQSGHVAGSFHAAARAISGGPIYTTEKIGSENIDVFRKLSTKDGKIPRCMEPGRICRESLFTDILNDGKAIKIYNTNRYNGVVGVFNCTYKPDDKKYKVTEKISVSDIEGFTSGEYAVWSFNNGKLLKQTDKDANNIELGLYGFDIFTYSKIQNGFAPIGMVDKFNPGGMILNMTKIGNDGIIIRILGGGKFVAYSEQVPKNVFIDDKEINFDYKDKSIIVNTNIDKESDMYIKF